ncbi:IS3 family transposase, partial [Acetobacter thailandicus]|nr:IS3 family transposase [Acetobacter thailandicus]
MVTPVAKRQAVRHIQEALALSERRACALVGVARRIARYVSTGANDAALRQRLRELADQRRRFGYRRLGYLLAREGYSPNHKKLFRLYQEEELKVRHRGGRKRALGTRSPMTIPQKPGQRWSLDFVSDALICGCRFRILADWREDYNTVRPHSQLRGTSTFTKCLIQSLATAILRKLIKNKAVLS